MMPRPKLIQWPLSILFTVEIYVMMLIVGLVFLPWALADRRGAHAAVRSWCHWVRFSARWLVGLKSEVRGEVPQGEVLIASKHQSFFDIIIMVSECPRPKFVMKRELVRVPVLGWFALRIGCIPVDRAKRGAALKKMLADVEAGRDEGGQLIIYPQGTRVSPASSLPYKVGTALIFRELKQTCVPAATNVGVFWPRRGMYRKPGLAVVEFLEPITPGMGGSAFMTRLEDVIETASDRLMLEAGFDAKAAREAAR